MKIPSDVSYIKKVSSEIEAFLKSANVKSSIRFDIRLAVEEAVKNSIIHGNKKNKELPVVITYLLEGGKFTIEIEDRGMGFKPEKVPDPTHTKNLTKAGGRGVFLIMKLMDEAKYNDRGNKVFMVKFINDKKGER